MLHFGNINGKKDKLKTSHEWSCGQLHIQTCISVSFKIFWSLEIVRHQMPPSRHFQGKKHQLQRESLEEDAQSFPSLRNCSLSHLLLLQNHKLSYISPSPQSCLLCFSMTVPEDPKAQCCQAGISPQQCISKHCNPVGPDAGA